MEHTYQALNASEQLFSTIQDAEARQRGYLLTGEQQYLAVIANWSGERTGDARLHAHQG